MNRQTREQPIKSKPQTMLSKRNFKSPTTIETNSPLDGIAESTLRQACHRVATLGYQLIRAGRYEQADVLFEGLAELQPSIAYFQIALGVIKGHRGQYDAATNHFQRASTLAPTDPLPEISLAELLLARSEFRAATSFLQSAQKKAVQDSAIAVKIRTLLTQAKVDLT